MLAFSERVSTRLRESGLRAVVTGAGGWLGRATLELLDRVFGAEVEKRVIAYASTAREMVLSSGRPIPIRPLSELPDATREPALVYHYAYLGKEKVAEYGVRDFLETNRRINDTVVDYCAALPSGGVFFASSGAAHFARGSDTDPDREPYGAAKVADERRFLSLATENRAAIVCRIFNMGGPYINKLDAYALSCILQDLLNERPVTLRASQPVYRSFVHVRDIIELVTWCLMEGDCPAVPFDTAGDEIIEVGELASRAASVLGRPDWQILRPDVDSSREDRYVGDGAVFKKLADKARLVLTPLDQQISDTAEYLQSLN